MMTEQAMSLAASKEQAVEVRALTAELLTLHPLELGPMEALDMFGRLRQIDALIAHWPETAEGPAARQATALLASGDQLVAQLRTVLVKLREERAAWEAAHGLGVVKVAER